jgi:hypothetical protein
MSAVFRHPVQTDKTSPRRPRHSEGIISQAAAHIAPAAGRRSGPLATAEPQLPPRGSAMGPGDRDAPWADGGGYGGAGSRGQSPRRAGSKDRNLDRRDRGVALVAMEPTFRPTSATEFDGDDDVWAPPPRYHSHHTSHQGGYDLPLPVEQYHRSPARERERERERSYQPRSPPRAVPPAKGVGLRYSRDMDDEYEEPAAFSRKPPTTKNVSFDQSGNDEVERMIAMLESQNQRYSMCSSRRTCLSDGRSLR